MERLTGRVQDYAWGSTHLLAELRGTAPTDQPEAEIWYGAHAKAPSTVDGGSTLLDVIEADPVGQLGQSILDDFGPQLPFLVKLLAADSPLSIQAHPSAEQARAGFAAEEAAGIDRGAPHRSFRDPNPKPELVFALGEFEALVGFRPIAETQDFLRAIGFDGFGELLEGGPKSVVEALLAPDSSESSAGAVADLISVLVDSCERYEGDGWAGEAALIVRLNGVYPNDPGVGVAALLNFLVLQPGEAMFLDAGNMHAYVSGLAVEVMANSDNVVRGGLTPKHIDVPTLLDIVVPDQIHPNVVGQAADGSFETPSPEFSMTAHRDPAGHELVGPQIVVGIEGTMSITGLDPAGETLELAPTDGAWLAAGERAVLNGTGLCASTTTRR